MRSQTSVKINTTEYKQLKKVAKENGQSISFVLSRAVKLYLIANAPKNGEPAHAGPR